MNRRLTAIVEREGDGYVALCPEASQGDTVAEALVLYRYRPTPTARHSVAARSPYLPTFRTRASSVTSSGRSHARPTSPACATRRSAATK